MWFGERWTRSPVRAYMLVLLLLGSIALGLMCFLSDSHSWTGWVLIISGVLIAVVELHAFNKHKNKS